MIPFSMLERYEGNKALFQTVMMSVISTYAGEPLHLHAEGLRGTGKTTIMRAARGILPTITRIKGCIYNCDPQQPHCPEHSHLNETEISILGTEDIPIPFLEISHSAKIGTVAGSIDLARLTDISRPEAHLLPGLIPQAHRGIIFIDEINRLADTSPEITDILLDVMGNKPGHLQIEEAGLPTVDIPVSVSVWAASNPDEDPGPLEEIRRQLSDRFDLICNMGRPDSVDIIAHILEENSYEYRVRKSKQGLPYENQANQRYQQDIIEWAEMYQGLLMPDFLRSFIARLYLKYNLESIRAIEAIQQAAILHAVLQRRNKVMISDVTQVIPMALKHRIDGDRLLGLINEVDNHKISEGILSFKNRPNQKSREQDEDYFQHNARPLRDMHRGELVNTENIEYINR
ncbi:putative chelatase [hydrocarbon metagenome]|uniref:Putative chelatase n=1 Tax=hydrocarbon metagenome TaxID=938273 RepID=A0A0W8E269_9ZZZZ